MPCFSKLTIFPFEELAETTFSNSRAKILLLLHRAIFARIAISPQQVTTGGEGGMTFILRLKIGSIFFFFYISQNRYDIIYICKLYFIR